MADFTFKVDVSGFEGMLERMLQFPDRFQKKGARVATRKAANVVRNFARQRAKALDRTLTKQKIYANIVTNESQRGGQREGGIKMRVGVMGGALAYPGRLSTGQRVRVRVSRARSDLPGGDTRYWRHLEFGTRYMRARPFLLPALVNNAQQVTDRLANELQKELEKLASFMGPLRP